MSNNLLIKKILFFLLVPFSLQAQYQNGGYIGSIDINKQHKVIILNAVLQSEKFEVYLPSEKNSWQLNQGTINIVNGEKFIIKSLNDSVAFIIKSVDSSGFKGDVTSKTQTGTFTFLKIKPIDYDLNKQLAGSYQIAKDEIIDLGPMDEMSGTLVYLNSKTLRAGVLLPVSDTKFISGPSLGIPYPVNDVVTFIRNKNNQPAGLSWLDKTGKKITAKKIAPFSRVEVSVMNDSVILKGDLLIPLNGKQQHPAVIFAHGSGDAKRNIGIWNIFFVRLGFAVLSFDKRGVGGSTNDWFTSTLDEIAGDWLKGVAYLKTRKEIDSKRIGVHGSSQGGWTTPIMAANNKDIAFIIVRVGSGQNVATTMAHEIGWIVREEGFTAAQQIEAQKNAEDVFNLVINNSPWDNVKPLLDFGSKQPWAPFAFHLQYNQKIWQNKRGWARLNLGYDNYETLTKTTCPVLWFFADNDHNVPTKTSLPRLKEALQKAGNKDVTIVSIKNASHGFTETKSGNNNDFIYSTHLASGYWSKMEEWLKKRFIK